MSKTTITLKHPFTGTNGDKVTEVNLRRATAGDLERQEEQGKGKGNVVRSNLLIRDLAELPLEDVRKLDIADYEAINIAITGQTEQVSAQD